MDTPSMVNVKAEPVMKEKQCESLHIKIQTTDESEIFDDKLSAMVDIKNEPEHEIKLEKSEVCDPNDQSSSSYQMKAENFEEMDAEFEVLGAEAAEKVKNKIVVIKRWMFCVPFKTVVEGTPFVPFKMPFCGSEVQPCSVENRFPFADLMQEFPAIGLIVDLSNNSRTYRVSELTVFGVQYVSIPVQFENSTSVPNIQQLNQFLGTFSLFSDMHPDKLIGVHDQLGNRATAYMICKALEKSGIEMKLAMKRFEDARSYPIYADLAGVLNGNRQPWIPKADFIPYVKRFGGKKRKQQRNVAGRVNTHVKCEFDPNKQMKAEEQSNTERKSQKQRKTERRAMKEQKAKHVSANRYKTFLATL